jgi:hypothetical protein
VNFKNNWGMIIMNKNSKVFLSLLFLIFNLYSESSHIITFFIEPYPTAHDQHFMKQNTSLNQDVFCTYYGYKTVSDNNGQVVFPLKTQDSNFYLLITDQAEPVFMLHNTLSHWKVPAGKPYELFSVSRLYDEETKTHFWSIEQTQLTQDGQIPFNTITIVADSKSFYIPTGISITTESQHYVLPTLYIKNETKLPLSALQFLENCEFFAPLAPTNKTSPAV